jgi:hypothetical protein
MIEVNIGMKYIVIGCAGLLLIVACLAVGYGLASSDPAVVCKNHIARSAELKNQVDGLELRLAQGMGSALLKCTEREQGICLKKIEEVTERIRKLRCKICSVRKNK